MFSRFHIPSPTARERTARRRALMPALALIAALAAPPATTDDSDNDELPEWGDSAALILTPAHEKRIGQQFVRQLLKDRTYVGDLELNAYLNQLGAKVAENASLRGTPISVHLLQRPELNAFAVPGGHITFHTGLLLAAADESELAAVMGHEIAHISQRHLPRMLAKAEASKLPAAAAILASVLVGGQAGLAGLTVTNAALLSNQLAYTRDFEREADSIGIKLLAGTDYDPAAMARFFGKLDGAAGLGSEVPEFLRTHPLSYTRIAEAENRAAAYPVKDYAVSRAFLFARAKIRALYTRQPREAADYFTDQTGKSSGAHKDAAVYGLALAQRKLRQFERARATLKPLLEAHPNEAAFQLAQAELDLISGNPAAAARRYERLVDAQPQLAYVTHYQAEALIASGDPASAKRIIRHQLRRHKEMLTLYQLLSKSNVKLGMLAEAHQANAEFHAALGDYPAAVSSLKLALRESASEGYLRESISARLSELEGVLVQQQR